MAKPATCNGKCLLTIFKYVFNQELLKRPERRSLAISAPSCTDAWTSLPPPLRFLCLDFFGQAKKVKYKVQRSAFITGLLHLLPVKSYHITSQSVNVLDWHNCCPGYWVSWRQVQWGCGCWQAPHYKPLNLGKKCGFPYPGPLHSVLACCTPTPQPPCPKATGGRALDPHTLRHFVVPRPDSQRKQKQQPGLRRRTKNP